MHSKPCNKCISGKMLPEICYDDFRPVVVYTCINCGKSDFKPIVKSKLGSPHKR